MQDRILERNSGLGGQVVVYEVAEDGSHATTEDATQAEYDTEAERLVIELKRFGFQPRSRVSGL